MRKVLILLLAVFGVSASFATGFANDSFAEESEELGNVFSGSLEVYYGYTAEDFGWAELARSRFAGDNYKVNTALQEGEPINVYGILNLRRTEKLNDVIKYGFAAEVEADSSRKSWFGFNEASVFLHSENTGTRIIGLQKPVTSKMRVDAGSIAGESGGLAGQYASHFKMPLVNVFTGKESIANSKGTNPVFITLPLLPVAHGFGSTANLAATNAGIVLQPERSWGESAASLSYVSLRKNGFRFGMTYTPSNEIFFNNFERDFAERPVKSLLNKLEEAGYNPHLKNVIAPGLSYYDSWGNVEVALSALYEYARVSGGVNKMRPLNAYQFGFNLGYLGFTLGGSFFNWQESMQVEGIVLPNNNYYVDTNGFARKAGNSFGYTYGVGYQIDKHTLSLAHMYSQYAGNIFKNWLVTFETQMIKDMTQYLQVSRYQFISATQYDGDIAAFSLIGVNTNLITGNNTNGLLLVVGLKYNF